MEEILIPPAQAVILGIPAVFFSILIPIVGIGVFAYVMYRRVGPLFKAAPDPRFDRLRERFYNLLKYAIAQYRQPRYPMAGYIHILLFAGFMIISLHSISLVFIGIWDRFTLPGLGGAGGVVYGVLKEIAATCVLGAALMAMVRRGIFKPERYDVPHRFGKDHTREAVFVLLLISGLMVSDALFEGSLAAARVREGMNAGILIPGTLNWLAAGILGGKPLEALQRLHIGAYFAHELIFFFFLCFLPFGKHFHVLTSLPNVLLMKLDRGTVKPVRWDVPEKNIETLESFGVKKIEDFTWKHMLDFYSCADCGRCSDNCPATAAGRPLSPRFISIKCRDEIFGRYPVLGASPTDGAPLIGRVLEEDEIWSCTTCGACEQECPILIEYIHKIVDLRRGMVEDGLVPQSLQKPLSALEKRGNPYGKMEKKRAEWAKALPEEVKIKVLNGGGESAETLYFVDSVTSFDDRIQAIGRATARVLSNAGVDFGILGPAERDSGHEVRRFGEEMLFIELRNRNTEAILESGARRIVTADPHAYNALKKDYNGLPPVEHISQTIHRSLKTGTLRLKPIEDGGAVYTYHDPCYLGRHNGLYDVPREVLDAIPGMRRVEMSRCRDRSFCCGGGGLMLYYEPVEETRIGVLRVRMARKTGADVIVTACPFCMVNIEDAIKTSGLEGKMQVIDLVELIERQMA